MLTDTPDFSNPMRPMESEMSSTSSDRVFHHQMRLRTVNIPRYPPFRTTLAAILFLIGGITFLIAGLVVYFGPSSGRGIPMIILGSISK